MFQKLTITTLMFLAILIPGCFYRTPTMKYYALPYPETITINGLEGAAPLSAWIAVMEFEGSAAFETNDLAWMPSFYSFNYYSYHRWVAPPARLVTERIRHDLNACGLFSRASDNAIQANYVLRGYVKGFHEEDLQSQWNAVLRINIELEKSSSRDLLLNHSYSYRLPLIELRPLVMVETLNKGMDQFIQELTRDIYKAIKTDLQQ